MALNEKYWADRQAELWANLEKDESQLIYKLSQEYDRQLDEFDKGIASYYSKYGKNNVIDYSTLMQGLSPAEKTMAIEKWDQFIAKNPELTHLTPVRESIYKYNRLQGLQDSILRQQLKIGVMDKRDIERHLIQTGTAGIRAGYTAQGMADMMNAMNPKQIEQLINKNWTGAGNYSDAIWKDKQKLAKYLGNDFATGVSRGESYDSLIKKLRGRFSDVSNADARRLVYTEGTFTMNESMISAFEGRFEEYKYSAHIDSRTSDVCQGLNGQIFKVEDRSPGTNFPPMHPRCRSTFEIVIPDEQGQAPPPVSPPKVTGGPKNPMNTQGGIKAPPVVQPPMPTFSLDNGSEVYKSLGKYSADDLSDMINATQDAHVINFWNKFLNKVHVADSNYTKTECYKHTNNGIHFRKSEIALDSITGPKFEVLLHEAGHWSDFNHNGSQQFLGFSVKYGKVGKEFDAALRADVDVYVKQIRYEFRDTYRSEYLVAKANNDTHWFWTHHLENMLEDPMGRPKILPDSIDKASAADLKNGVKHLMTQKHQAEKGYDIHNVCDVISGATKNKYYTICGHKTSYWNDPYSLSVEAFAEMISSRTVNRKSYEMFKKICPTAVGVFEKMLEEMVK